MLLKKLRITTIIYQRKQPPVGTSELLQSIYYPKCPVIIKIEMMRHATKQESVTHSKEKSHHKLPQMLDFSMQKL